ncbi:MAG TPA: hypothetical protein VGD17_00620 [Chitinophagaceae bacterium]
MVVLIREIGKSWRYRSAEGLAQTSEQCSALKGINRMWEIIVRQIKYTHALNDTSGRSWRKMIGVGDIQMISIVKKIYLSDNSKRSTINFIFCLTLFGQACLIFAQIFV